MADLIEIDGSSGEGGGQMLRTALSLAACTGQGFRLFNVRARRERPGLQPQHLWALRAAARLCGATVHGDFHGSTELSFDPGDVRPGHHEVDIGTAGSTTLVLQTLLPPLLSALGPSELRITSAPSFPCCVAWAPAWSSRSSGAASIRAAAERSMSG